MTGENEGELRVRDRLVLMIGVIGILLVPIAARTQSDTTRVAPADSSGYNPDAIAEGQEQIADYLANHFGFDLFATGEAYSLHFRRVGFFSMSGAVGLGTEVRVAPVFIGGIIGTSGNEIPRQPSVFYYSSLYAGFMIDGYRIEFGNVYGVTNTLLSTHPPPLAAYKSYFAGIGRRYGSGFFFEPEIKFMFPVVATYYYHENIPGSYGYPGYDTAVGTDNSGLRDLFFALSVKVGVCLVSDH